MHDESRDGESHQSNQSGMHQLASDQRAAPFSQHLAGVDALDAERNLRESKVDEIDDSDENQ